MATCGFGTNSGELYNSQELKPRTIVHEMDTN